MNLLKTHGGAAGNCFWGSWKMFHCPPPPSFAREQHPTSQLQSLILSKISEKFLHFSPMKDRSCETNRHTDIRTEIQITWDRHTHRKTYRQKVRKTDRQTGVCKLKCDDKN